MSSDERRRLAGFCPVNTRFVAFPGQVLAYTVTGDVHARVALWLRRGLRDGTAFEIVNSSANCRWKPGSCPGGGPSRSARFQTIDWNQWAWRNIPRIRRIQNFPSTRGCSCHGDSAAPLAVEYSTPGRPRTG